MEDIEDLIEALHIVYTKLSSLQQMSGPEMLLPGRVASYRSTLEDAYAAYSRAATRVEELGQQLEEEHRRLDLGVRQYGPRADE